MSSSEYLLAGQVSELERLKLQSRVWEPTGRRLLEEIGDGRGGRAADIGCGVLGWLRVLSNWIGPDGEVVGTDVDDAMLAEAERFVADEGLGNVSLRAAGWHEKHQGQRERPQDSFPRRSNAGWERFDCLQDIVHLSLLHWLVTRRSRRAIASTLTCLARASLQVSTAGTS
jgi:SAM-dependent methyltransferase